MPSPSDAALAKLEEMLARDPLLRDVIGHSLPRASRGSRFVPDIDVLELEDRYLILLDVPGVSRESLDVQLDGMTLIVKGDKPARHPAGARSKVAERGVGHFRREFQLPCLVDGGMVSAKLADGVLRIEVPRASGGKPVRVDVAKGES